MIPQANPRANYEAHRERIDAAMTTVLASGRYVLGPQVESFERALATYLHRPEAVGVASGTDALHLALRVSGIRPGDEVVTPSLTAVATVAAIELAGARPVFADIDPVSLTLDPDSLSNAINPRVRAVVAVHLYGHPADMGRITAIARRHGLVVVEDCAQALGARDGGVPCGSFGDVAAFSFYPTKNLGALGDGGALATDATLAARARALREYGWNDRRESQVPGLNTRLDELQAAILRVKLEALDAENERRRAIAGRYRAVLSGSNGIVAPHEPCGPASLHAWHQFVVRTPNRSALMAHLAARGIGHAIHYAVPVHRQPAYAGRFDDVSLPETERATREVLSLPIWPEMSEAELAAVEDALVAFTG